MLERSIRPFSETVSLSVTAAADVDSCGVVVCWVWEVVVCSVLSGLSMESVKVTAVCTVESTFA